MTDFVDEIQDLQAAVDAGVSAGSCSPAFAADLTERLGVLLNAAGDLQTNRRRAVEALEDAGRRCDQARGELERRDRLIDGLRASRAGLVASAAAAN